MLIAMMTYAIAQGAIGGPEQLTVDRVVELGLARHPEVNAARAQAESRRNDASSVRGRLFPTIAVSDEYAHYTEPFTIDFGGNAFEARKQDTNTFAASATQPLLGLLGRIEHYRAALAGADASATELAVAEASLREGLEIAYLQLFESLALESIALESKRELDAQRAVVESKVRAGAMTDADRLRVEVSARAAEQEAIEARTRAEGARAVLLGAIGLSPVANTVELLEPVELLKVSKSAPPSYDEAHQTALEQRPELRAAVQRQEAADHQRMAAWFDLLPEIDAEAVYLHADGQTFVPNNQGYVGVTARWRVFEGGASFYQQRSASAQAEAAALSADDAKEKIEVELAQRLAALRAAQSAISVSEKAIESATEAYRVMKVQVEEGAATTTDLLDSESALSQARLRRARAEYETAIAWVQLVRARGR